MTIARVGQLTAELNTILDVQLYGGSAFAPSISTTKYKTGARSYAFVASGAPFGLGLNDTTGRVGFWINHNGGTTTPTLVLWQIDTSLIQVRWNVTSNVFEFITGYVMDSYTPMLLATVPAGTFSIANTWRHIGMFLDYQTSAGHGAMAFYVDGIEIFSYTGVASPTGIGVYPQNSHAIVAGDINGVYGAGYRSAGAWGDTTYLDDFYLDTMVGESYGAVPAKRFLFSLANGAGAHADWTPLSSTNISNVDDLVTSEHDGDTTYVKALAANLVDTYTTADITLPVDHAIVAVLPIAIARKTDAADCKLALIADDGTNVTTGTSQVLPTAYGTVFERMALQPDGTAWNETDFNAMEFGFKSAGTFI